MKKTLWQKISKGVVVQLWLFYFVKVLWSHSLWKDGTLCRLLEKELTESTFAVPVDFLLTLKLYLKL